MKSTSYTEATAHATIRTEIECGYSPRTLDLDALADGAHQVAHVSHEDARSILTAALARYEDLTDERKERGLGKDAGLWLRYYNDGMNASCFCPDHFDIERVESDVTVEVLDRTDNGAGEVSCERCGATLAS